MSRKQSIIILGLLMLLGVWERATQLSQRSLWFDEAFSWQMIQFPLLEIIVRTSADVHPPLYYLLLKGWTALFSSSVIGLRSFSVAASVLTIPFSYLLIADSNRSRGIGLIATLLVTISGWQIAIAQEARMYALGVLLTVMATWLLLKATRLQRASWWLSYAAITTALLYTHYYGIFIIAAHALWVILWQRHRVTWHTVVAPLIVITLTSPWLPIFLAQNRQVQTAFWIPKLTVWSVPQTLYRLFLPQIEGPFHDAFWQQVNTISPLVLFLALCAWLVARSEQSNSTARLLVMAIGSTFLGSSLVSLWGQSVFQDRFFSFAQVLMLALLALSFARLRHRSLQGALVLFLTFSLGMNTIAYRQQLQVGNKPGLRAAIATIVSYPSPPSTPILVSSPFIFFGAKHYLQEEHHGAFKPYLYTLSGDVAHFAGSPVLTEADNADKQLLADTDLTTVWVVDTTGFGSTTSTLPSEWVRTVHARFQEVFPFQGEVIISQYQRSGS